MSPLYNDYDDCDYDDGPTKGECDAEDFRERVIDSLKESDEYLELAGRLEEADAAEYAVIEAEMEEMLDPSGTAFENAAYELADAEAEARDPHGYRGVSRSDFI